MNYLAPFLYMYQWGMDIAMHNSSIARLPVMLSKYFKILGLEKNEEIVTIVAAVTEFSVSQLWK